MNIKAHKNNPALVDVTDMSMSATIRILDAKTAKYEIVFPLHMSTVEVVNNAEEFGMYMNCRYVKTTLTRAAKRYCMELNARINSKFFYVWSHWDSQIKIREVYIDAKGVIWGIHEGKITRKLSDYIYGEVTDATREAFKVYEEAIKKYNAQIVAIMELKKVAENNFLITKGVDQRGRNITTEE
ncbi:MAG: hypothetical protein PHX51_08490 [Clostridia bacterium]|nr:hypothetical protein [Clostridia bacterium]